MDVLHAIHIASWIETMQGEEKRKFGKFLFAKKSVVDCMHNKKIWRANKWSKGWG